MTEHQVSRLAELIRGIESAMLTTISPEGSMTSRPMLVQDFPFEGELWFYTHRESGKVEDIRADGRVCVAFMDPHSDRYISVSGTAEVIDDVWSIAPSWSHALERWFPRGPGDDDLALIKVDVEHAEYWDAPHGEMMERLEFKRPMNRPRTDQNHSDYFV